MGSHSIRDVAPGLFAIRARPLESPLSAWEDDSCAIVSLYIQTQSIYTRLQEEVRVVLQLFITCVGVHFVRIPRSRADS